MNETNKCNVTSCNENKAVEDSLFCNNHRTKWRRYCVIAGLNYPLNKEQEKQHLDYFTLNINEVKNE